MTTPEVDVTIQEYRRRQNRMRIGFVVVLIGVLASTVAILAYSGHRARQAEVKANNEKQRADIATKSLETIAGETLKRVQQIDEQAKNIAQGQNPTVYLWRDGLHPKSKRDLSGMTDRQLIDRLLERRSLLMDAGPVVGASADLKNYVCEHAWHVIGESILISKAEEYRSGLAKRDARFQFAVAAPSPTNEKYAAIIVGEFMTRHEAQELVKEIGHDAFPRQWGFGFEQYQLNCSAN